MTKHSPSALPLAGRRQRLAEVAMRFGITSLLRPLHDRGRQAIPILAYHRITPFEGLDSYPLDAELISATPEEFEWQMAFIRRTMNPVSLTQIADSLDTGTPLPPRPVAVTFDDGFSDTYVHAYPVLRRHSIPACVFITTGYLDGLQPFWFEFAAQLMMQLEPGAIEIGDLRLPTGTSDAERRSSLRALHSVLKSLPNNERTRMTETWAHRYPKHYAAANSDQSRPMSWAQLCEMVVAGIEVGSHTVTHPNLAQLADEDIRQELQESRRVLQKRLDRPVETLAYPIGTQAAYDTRVMQLAKAAGFRLALSYVPGANWNRNMARFELRRLGVGLSTSRTYFRAMLQLPDWLH